MPLRFHGERLGALLLLSDAIDVQNEESVTFAQAVAGQVSRALALARASAAKDTAAAAKAQAAILQEIVDSINDTMAMVLVPRLVESRREARASGARAPVLDVEIDPFLGTSALISALAEEAARVAASPSPVLIAGETGVGKGVLARWLHRNGRRAKEAFVDLNCAGLSRELVESELFGHERGAFTGAVVHKQGLFEVAHRGTIFLDEIGDLELALQPKLLTVLEERRFRRVGDVRDRTIDFRLVAATHRDLPALVQSARFRADLYFRISPLVLQVPPLRARPEDVVPIARALLARLAKETGRGTVELAPEAGRALMGYAWPGNVRELRNVLERALLFSDSHVVERAALRFESGLRASGGAADERSGTLADIEKAHIERTLAAEDGNVPRAALRLGIPRSSLYALMKRLGLSSTPR